MTVQLDSMTLVIRALERQLMAWRRSNAASQRLETIPGVGLITATPESHFTPRPGLASAISASGCSDTSLITMGRDIRPSAQPRISTAPSGTSTLQELGGG